MTHDQRLLELAARLDTVEPIQDWTAQLHPKPEKYERYVAVLTKDQRDTIVSALRALSAECGVKVIAPGENGCCKGLAAIADCRCEQERKAAGYPPYHRGSTPSALSGLGESSTSSDGGVESRHAFNPEAGTGVYDLARQDPARAGVAPGPSEATTIPGTDDMDARFAWLESKAADMGYTLVREPEHPDSPHVAEDREAVALTEVEWLKRRTAETGRVIVGSERAHFLELMRFAERAILSTGAGR